MATVVHTREVGLRAVTPRTSATATEASIAAVAAVASAAQTTANIASTDAGLALTALTNLASDNILSPSEKPAVVLQYSTITSEQAGIDARATAYSITTEKTAYDSAVSALTSYLGTLSGWNTIPGSDVAIVGTTFRTNFGNVYSTRQTLLNRVAEIAGTVATWSGVTGTGRPSDYATADLSLVATGGVVATGNSIIKSSGSGGWNAQAYSVESYIGGAYVSCITTAISADTMLGLNTDPTTDASYTSLDYAIQMGSDGNLYAYTSGSGTLLTTWSIGDSLVVAYDNINVRFIKNGVVLRTVTASAPNMRFYLDSSIAPVGSGLSNIRFGPFTSSVNELSMNLPAGYTKAGTTITKSTAATGWTESAHSVVSYSGGAIIEAQNNASTSCMIGLNTNPNTAASFTNIDFALYVGGSVWFIYLNGVETTNGAISTTAMISVAYDGSVVRFLVDGIVVYTKSVGPGIRFYGEVAINGAGAYLSNLRFAPLSSNYFQRSGNMVDASWWSPSVLPSSQWAVNNGNNTFTPGTLPDGTTGIVWNAVDTGADPAGGWSDGIGNPAHPSNSFPVDINKTYVFSVYIKSISGNGTHYFGVSGSMEICNLNTTTVNTNPYFAATGKINDTNWYLFIGVIYPYNTTGHTNGISGVYNCRTGQKVLTGSNYNWGLNGSLASTRAYQYYSDTGSVSQFCWPSVYLCDGGEPSLDDMLSMAATTARNPITNTNVNTYISDDAIITSKLLVTGRGKAINEDPGCVDSSAWIYDIAPFTLIADSTAPYGTNSMQCVGQSQNKTLPFSVSAGKTYKLSLWAKSSGGSAPAYLRVHMYDGSGTLLSYLIYDQTINPPTLVPFEGMGIPATWTKYTGFGVAPAGAVRAEIILYLNWVTSATTWVTDVRCEEYIGSDLIVDGSVTTRHMTTNGLIVRKTDGTPILSADAASLPWVTATEILDSTTGTSLLYPWNPSNNTRTLKNIQGGNGITLALVDTNPADQYVVINAASSESASIKNHLDRTTTVTTLSDISGMSFSLAAFTTYIVRGILRFSSASTNTGINLGITVPTGAITTLKADIANNTTGGSETRNINLPSGGSGNCLFTFSSDTSGNQLLTFECLVIVGATLGLFQLRYATEVNASAITLNAGSTMLLHTITNNTTSAVYSLITSTLTNYSDSDYSVNGNPSSSSCSLTIRNDGTFLVNGTGSPTTGNWANATNIEAGPQWQLMFVVTGPNIVYSIGSGGTVSYSNSAASWTTLTSSHTVSMSCSVPGAVKYREANISVAIRFRRLDNPAVEYLFDTVTLSASATSEM